MSWLYTIIFAGLVFSSENNLSVPQNAVNYNESNTTKVVKLDEIEKFEQTYPLSANGRVSVSNVNGSITIETWDNNQVKLEVTKIADSKERLSQVEVEIDSKPDSFKVETNYDNWRREGTGWRNGGKLEIQYRLTVPRNSVLNEIETVNGSINISNGGNMTKASAVNGNVKAVNLRGNANLSTVNGTVEADFDQLQTGSRISLNTVNGKVFLTIPSDANATVKADSVNGNISNEFGLPVRKGQYVGRDLYGKIGNGDVQIRLNSVNGELAIKRKNDGKNPNPAINLLPQKSQEEDWDNNESRTIDKERQKNDREVKKIDKEVAKINSEINKITTENIQAIAPVIVESVANIAIPQISEESLKKMQEAQIKQQEALRNLNANLNLNSPTIEKRSGNFSVKGTPKVTIDAKNCAVTVRGWDKSEVQYLITKISKNRVQTPLDIKTQNSDRAVEINVKNADAQNNYLNDLNQVVIEVFVPKKSNLRVVSNREIRLEGISGEMDLSGAGSAVNVRDSDGKLSVKTSEGKIRVIGFKGEIISQTDCGEIDLEGDFQNLTAQTNEGKIVLTLPENTNATFNSDVEIESEGFNLVREDEESMAWRIGKGNLQYNLIASNGQVFIRNANVLKAN